MEVLKNSKYAVLSDEEERIGKCIIDAAYKNHSNLGPGLLVKVYETCLTHLLLKQELDVKRQVDIPISFEGIIFNEGLRLDLLVNNLVIVEIKALENVNPVWQAQLLSHLKLTGKRLGYLINFNVPQMKLGIKRMII